MTIDSNLILEKTNLKKPISLSKGNENEEVNPHEIKGSSGRRTNIEYESSDQEEEYTSDKCEDDDEDGAELDISSSSEEEIWCVEDDRAPVLGGAAVGGVCWRHQVLVSLLLLILEYQSLFIHIINAIKFVIAAGPSSVSPTIAAAAGSASVSPPVAAGSGQYTPSPNKVVGLVSEDVRNHRFTHRSDEARSRLVWTMSARSNFKHLLYNVRKNAQKFSQSVDPTLWRERAPTSMRRDYWESMCNIWAAERWQQTSTTMKVNRAANPEANMHTSGSVSFATHQSRLEKELKRLPTFQEVFNKTHKKKGTDQYISDRAREVAESYNQHMTEKYAGQEKQPQLDLEVWVAASGAPKKGHVYGFGHSMGTTHRLVHSAHQLVLQ
ncbi:hypothetical protein Taro_016218, partial [Colocasia esculenta]|nr:hypothetical protein [Colocasia esculenta]